MRVILNLTLALSMCTPLLAAEPVPAPLPPLPSDFPVEVTRPAPIVRRTVNPRQQRQITLPQFPRPQGIQSLGNPVRPPTLRPAIHNTVDQELAWDSVLKEFTAKAGDTEAQFSFGVTNIGKSNVVINWVRPSCGCTVAKLPPTPWTLQPGETGQMDFTLDLKGKRGTLFKYISIDTSHGQKMLNIRATIPEGTTVAGMDSRVRNMQLAMADRQIVFRGDCARCHSAPLAGKTSGEHIYQAGCAICHDTPNRATMVPDLAAVPNPGTKEYWQVWIRHGKPGTLMPAFSHTQGGPLTEAQIQTLSAYLTEKFPARAAAPITNAAPANPALRPTALAPAPTATN
jgi:cytochrome c553